MTIFFAGDTHFGHKGILTHMTTRPFENTDDMDEAIIERWNSVVTDKDVVYHLGDVSMVGLLRTCEVLTRLRGRKVLIAGNHDKPLRNKPLFEQFFEGVHDLLEIKIPDADAADGKNQRVVMCHYPMLTWNRAHHGSWAIHGHSHGSLDPKLAGNRLDAGIDVWNLTPVSYEQVKLAMRSKQAYFPDHHRPRSIPEAS